MRETYMRRGVIQSQFDPLMMGNIENDCPNEGYQDNSQKIYFFKDKFSLS